MTTLYSVLRLAMICAAFLFAGPARAEPLPKPDHLELTIAIDISASTSNYLFSSVTAPRKLSKTSRYEENLQALSRIFRYDMAQNILQSDYKTVDLVVLAWSSTTSTIIPPTRLTRVNLRRKLPHIADLLAKASQRDLLSHPLEPYTDMSKGLDKALTTFSTGNTEKILVIVTDDDELREEGAAELRPYRQQARERNISISAFVLGDIDASNRYLEAGLVTGDNGYLKRIDAEKFRLASPAYRWFFLKNVQ